MVDSRILISPDEQVASDDLAAKLRHEAGQSAPEFSPELHAKVMRAVDAARPKQACAGPAKLRIPLGAALLAGAIAAMAMLATSAATLDSLRVRTAARPALAGGFVPWNRGGSPPRPPIALFHEAARQVNLRVGNAVETAMERQEYAGLDHDVQLATRYLIDQAPFRSAWESEGPSR